MYLNAQMREYKEMLRKKEEKQYKLAKKPIRHEESQIQQAIIRYAGLRSITYLSKKFRLIDLLIAIPNGGKRNAIEAARLKKEGVKAGVSDLLLTTLPALWIEVKRPAGVNKKCGQLTTAQREWFDLQCSICQSCAVVTSLEEFIEVVDLHFNKIAEESLEEKK